ncbi:G patch domain-containing protein 4 [Biomphalaria pfeifferi]|uniref:G patch domain-containing protein 4 n=1 Tax=Biomphalaria pfeifferi TaxID=112525 RepID=A0AAD8BT78_BIOPF|nr:G patch domain-containing protein 4 [Biomphalaria pfeifferi]
MAQSEYAKRLLKKQGWKEGSGLGKKEHGIADPIKVTLKMDKTGVGHDPGKEFTDHWWLRVFNEAAQKIGKKKEITENDEKKKKADDKKNFYKGFVKSSTLTNGVELSSKDSESSEEESESNPDTRLPTLDDIHTFCGGATGHRAAMFGIKMKGKLSRVAEQEANFEKELNNKNKASPNGDSTVHSGNTESQKVKRKKRNISSEATDTPSLEEQEEFNHESQEISCDKLKKKKKRRREDKETFSLDIDDNNKEDMEQKVKKKKQKNELLEETVSKKKKELLEEINSEETVSKKKSKKKKRDMLTYNCK